jgi:hypothetical protein
MGGGEAGRRRRRGGREEGRREEGPSILSDHFAVSFEVVFFAIR